MKMMPTIGFNRARDFIHTSARPLERAIFELEFEDGSVDDFLRQLSKFQNPDGGFGRALEPDVRISASSALCTEIGLRYMAEKKIPSDHFMVQSAVKYLLDTFDAETQIWRVLPTEANDAPHAPWWHDEAGSLARTFDDFLAIPRAGILASLHHFVELVSAEWLNAVIEATVTKLEQWPTELRE